MKKTTKCLTALALSLAMVTSTGFVEAIASDEVPNLAVGEILQEQDLSQPQEVNKMSEVPQEEDYSVLFKTSNGEKSVVFKDDVYNQADATGFINLFGLSSKIYAQATKDII